MFMLSASCNKSFSQKGKGFTISGNIAGLKDGDVVRLGNRFADWHYVVWTDSCVIENGKFFLKGQEVPDQPRDYEIYFFKGRDGYTYDLEQTIDAGERYQNAHDLVFFVENGDSVVISGSVQQWKEIKISGTRSNEAYAWAYQLTRYADDLKYKINRRLAKIKDSVGYDRQLVQEQIQLKKNIDNYLDSATKNAPPKFKMGIPYMICTLHDFFSGYHGYFQKNLFFSLPLSMQNSYMGKRARNYALLSVGHPFPDFLLTDENGRKMSLKKLVGKNKITLVHFWGTNSVDRELYQNEVKIMYDKFRSNGLGVIGIAADTSKDDWEVMVRVKKYPWINVIGEPKGWKEGSLINDVYGEGGHTIPNTTNVILDNRGIILVWDVYGPELQFYLEELLTADTKAILSGNSPDRSSKQ